MPAALRCSWEVQAGFIPGERDPELMRQWHLTSEEWAGPDGGERFLALGAAANAYAQWLQQLCANGRACNWTRVDFVWY